ncbi:hypothetical protein K438DRAFT_1910519 [Mycena galopus ATCC 62051]|nr:hypothetical protein K438DRAFT_1910519 [Mycena galopus ATCC 62051]
MSESETIAALVLSATKDENPGVSLDQIYSTLCQSPVESSLDPLSLLPYLLPPLIALIGECGNAKEVMIAVQEILERVESALNEEDDDTEDSSTESPSDQLISLIHLYTSGNLSIPRLKLHKRSPSETIRPLLSQIASTIHLAGSRLQRDQGREIIKSVILQALLDTAVSECSHCIQSSIAQRSFEVLYPRLTIRSSVSLDWEDGEKAIEDALAVYPSFGQTFNLDSLPPVPTTTYLILLAHSKIVPSDICKQLSFMLPILVASIQANHTLDETFRQQLSPEISGPLCALLPSLASAHPDGDVRHQAFHLVTDTDFPQMRVAAVGLVKEAALDALRDDKPSVFASPIFLVVFGPVLFRSDPVDLFHAPDLALSALDESMEPARLVECLSLYYVLLLRDTLNRTGIRHADQIANVENTLLAPMRSTLSRWMDDTFWLIVQHMHAIMPLVSLKTVWSVWILLL